MKNFWCPLLVLLVVVQGVNANDNDPNDPKELLRTKWDTVISVLQDKDISHEAKEKEIDKIISPIFDFKLMAKLALGRKHWPGLTPPEREKFTQLFARRLKDSYREKILLYTDEKALLQPAIRKKKAIFISMQLVSKDKKIDMLYKLRKMDSCWKIYDVEIQGVSIILTYRSQFNDILRKGTVKDVFSQLEKPSTR